MTNSSTSLAPAQAAQEIIRRRAVRADFLSFCQEWCAENGHQPPALHHRLLISKLQDAANKGNAKLIVCMPPGSAKSAYISILFPAWYLAQSPNKTILGTSYAYSLIEKFGGQCRNLIKLKGKTLGYDLVHDSKAKGEWETTNGGRFFCAGVGSGIAGHRADLAFVDDPIGSEQDANSATFRETLWSWWVNDFVPRLKPNASRIVVANRRHEEDLVGMLLLKEQGWEVIVIKRVAEENDILGRQPGDRLWPEYFTQEMTDEAMRNPGASGLQQQEPSPTEGNFYKADDLDKTVYHSINELPENLNYYASSDHACSDKQARNNDLSCLIPSGVDSKGDIWILPDAWWERQDTLTVAKAMLALQKKHSPLYWWAGKEMITKSTGPFLRQMMRQEQVFINLIETASVKNKMARAQSFQARTASRTVHFPFFAPWWQKMRHELLSFPNCKHDDAVDALSELGRGLESLVNAKPSTIAEHYDRTPPPLTMRWLKDSSRTKDRANRLALLDR